MILAALTRYYETMAARGEIAAIGYGKSKVRFGLNLSDDGALLGVVPLQETVTSGKKTVERDRVVTVPEPVVLTSGVAANFLCHGTSYLLGYDEKGKPARTKECFEAARVLHQQILVGVQTPLAQAIVRYFDTWDGAKVPDNEVLRPYLPQILKGANLVFMRSMEFAHEDAEILHAWDRYYRNRAGGAEGVCLVTGERTAIAKIHPKIKGVRGAQSAGASLVSFNEPAFESYGHDGGQGANAPVGEYAAFAYTTALNALLADPNHRSYLGDMTVVYWSEDGNEAASQIIDMNLDPFAANDNENVDMLLQDVMKKVREGEPLPHDINVKCPFYILGLSPNAGRISVRFFLQNSFGGFIEQLHEHYERMEIVKAPYEREFVRIPDILNALSNPNATNKKPPDSVSGSLVRDILAGARYPETMLTTAMIRIRADRDDDTRRIRKISRERAAIIKAYLLRNSFYPNIEEECTVALNPDSTNRAYVVGRMFSVLESIQETANPGINATIKDRYFNAACATPAAVYPTLVKLSNHHLRKLEPALRKHYEKQLGELMDKLEAVPYPPRLTLEEQGLFTLGYYQQNQARYTKKTKEEI